MSQFFARLAQTLFSVAKSKHLVRVVGVLLVVGLFVALPFSAHAFFEPILQFASGILFWAANTLGKLTLLLFGILVQVAQYNDFINADAVTIGWRILRDLANMLFILVLLVIAFGTAFRVQQYRYNALLRQLIIMAVLINFSKLITGFFIDLVQVIMMTFVNAFADTAAGNLTTALGLDKVLMLNTAIPGDEITDLSVAGTLAIGVVMIAAMTIVTLLYVVIFLARIIFLWILIILSPLAYLFATFPSTRKYWSDWWRQFWQYAVIGPILAFFLWLTLTVTAAGNAALLLNAKNVNTQSTLDSGGNVTAAISAIGSQSGILSFLVAIMLLIFSLKTATTFSVAGAGWAASSFPKISRGLMRGATMPARMLGNGILAPAATAAAGGLTAALARSRIPLASSWGARQNARVNAGRKKWEEKQTKWMEDIKDPRIIEAMANRPGLTPAMRAQRKKARSMAPSTIGRIDTKADADFIREIQGMEMDDFKKLSPREQRRISEKLSGAGRNLAEVSKEKAAWLIKDASTEKRRASGFHTGDWSVESTTGNVLFRGGAIPAGTTTTADATVATDYQTRLLSDVDRAKYDATEKAIREDHGGDADAFFKSPKYLANQARFLGQEGFLETQALQRERERKLERGESRLEELTGVRTATRKGARGEAANLAMDFAEGEMLGLALGNAAGANLSGAEQKLAAGVLSEKYKSQQEEKEIDKRQQAMQEEADREYQREREVAARRGELGAVARREVSREEAAAAVKSDVAFQQSLEQGSAEFRSSLENAKSINLINKGRTGRSARQTLRHEETHNAVSEMDEKELNTYWKQLAPERQQEIEAFVRANWANGDKMGMRDIQEEFFTEAFSSHGRSKRLGPLGLNMEDPEKYQETRRVIDEEFGGKADAFYKSAKYRDNTTDYVQRDNMQRAVAEEELAERMSGSATLGKQTKARASVQTLAPEGVRAMWATLNPARREEIEEYISSDSDQLRFLKSGRNRSRFEETQQMINERYGGNARAFFDSNDYRNNRSNFLKEKDFHRGEQELVAAQKEALGSMLASFNGAETEGPLNFQKDEQELALLLRAAAEGKRPMTAPAVRPPSGAAPTAPPKAAAVSVAEVSTRPPRPQTVAAPSGSTRVTATPPVHATRPFEGPVSPIVQTTVINNTTVQDAAMGITRKIEGKLGMLPSRTDLLTSLQQLQNAVISVAREQGIADKEIHGLTMDLERLKADVRSPSQLPKDQEALHTNLRTFLARFKKLEKEAGEEPQADAAA